MNKKFFIITKWISYFMADLCLLLTLAIGAILLIGLKEFNVNVDLSSVFIFIGFIVGTIFFELQGMFIEFWII